MPGDLDLFVAYIDIDLGADAEFSFEVNAGLDGETNARSNPPRVARFEVIDVHSVAVDFFADRMPGPMCELIGITGARNDAARDIIDVRATNGFACLHIRAHEFDRGIARIAHDVEDARVFLRHRFADVAGPGLVGENRARLA